jgi:nicotinamide mononucleotide transporter
MSIVEWISVGFSLAYVVLLSREIIWAWPAGIIGSFLGLLVVFEAKLYLDSGLYLFYVLLGAYGWYLWVFGEKGRPELPIIHTPRREWLVLLGIGLMGTLGFGSFFATYTDADIPFWDAFTTSFSLVGTWMQVRKHLENWLLWLVVDAIYIGVYAYKGLFAFAILSGIYLILATYAYFHWQKRFSLSSAQS